MKFGKMRHTSTNTALRGFVAKYPVSQIIAYVVPEPPSVGHFEKVGMYAFSSPDIDV